MLGVFIILSTTYIFKPCRDPTPDQDDSWKELSIPKWKQFSFDDHNYMLMQHDFTVEKNYPDRYSIINSFTSECLYLEEK